MAIMSPVQNNVSVSEKQSNRIVYLCKLTQSLIWEEVTETVFKDRKHALSDNAETPRYTEDYVIYNYDTKEMTVSCKGISPEALGVVLRRFSISPPANTIPGGFIREPSTIRFKTPRSGYLLEVKTGAKYKRI